VDKDEKGQFIEGNKCGKGRPKGSQNKITRDIKEVINKFLEYLTDDKIKDIAERVDSVKPEVLINFVSKIAPKDLNISGELKTSHLSRSIDRMIDKEKDSVSKTE
jgi:hypothetical protein